MSWLWDGMGVLWLTLVTCAGVNATTPEVPGPVGVAARVSVAFAPPARAELLASRADADAWLAQRSAHLPERERSLLEAAVDETDFGRQRLWVESGDTTALPTEVQVRPRRVEIRGPHSCGGGAQPPPGLVVLRLPATPEQVTRRHLGRPCTASDLLRP